jgi:hypothetical protein
MKRMDHRVEPGDDAKNGSAVGDYRTCLKKDLEDQVARGVELRDLARP